MRYGPIAAKRRTAASTTARFYADPGVGNFYLAVSPNVSSIATHESKMGAPLAMIRLYGTGNTPPWAAADNVIAGGRIPWISWLEGGVPWRVLPPRISRVLQRTRHDRPVLELLQALFENLPEQLRAIERKPPQTQAPGPSTSPSRAA